MRSRFACIALLACCCHAESPRSSPALPAPLSVVVDAGLADAAAPPMANVASLDEIAALSPSLAPGLREMGRYELAVPGRARQALAEPQRDTCVRVAFASSAPVRASLEDSRGRVLAGAPRASSGAIGEAGPVCFVHGEKASIVVDSDEVATARLVVWGSP